MRFKIVESLYEGIADGSVEVELINGLKQLGEAGIIQAIYARPSYDIPQGPAFVTRDGKFIDVADTLNANHIDGEDAVHSDLVDLILDEVYYTYIKANDPELKYTDYDEWLGSGLYHEDVAYDLIEDVTKALGWVRTNFGGSWTENRLYAVLPEDMTDKQMYSVVEFLKEAEREGKDEYQVFFDTGDWAVKYSFDDVSPDDFLNIMRRYYNTGKKPIGESIFKRRKKKEPVIAVTSDKKRVAEFPDTDRMKSWLENNSEYHIEEVSLQDILDSNKDTINSKALYDPSRTWWDKDDITKYRYHPMDAMKWTTPIYGERKSDGSIRITDGRHRCVALVNSGYTHAEIAVKEAEE